jgi:hypothetical protein
VNARRVLASVAALACVTALLAASSRAGAQEPSLQLVSQTLLVRPGGSLDLVLSEGAGAPPDAELAITVNGPLAPARTGLQAAVKGDIRSATVGFVSIPVSEVARDAAGRLEVSVPTVVRQREKNSDNVRLGTNGLYAVRVDLRTAADDVLSRFTTFVVRVDDAMLAQSPLPVAMVLRADAPPSLQPNGSTQVDSGARTRLRAVEDIISRDATTPLTLALRPSLLEGLSQTGIDTDTTLHDDLANAVGSRQVLATTRERVDPSALTAAGLNDDLVSQLRTGEDALSDALDTPRPERTTWLADGPLDGDAITALRDLGVQQVVLPADAVDPASPLDTTATADLSAGEGALPLVAAVADERLSAALEPGDDPVLSAYRFLAELCSIQLDTAKDDRGDRGVVVVPDASWNADAAFVGTVLDGLRTTTLLRPLTLDSWFHQVLPAKSDDGSTQHVTLAPAQPASLAAHAQALRVTRFGVAVLSSMLPNSTALRTDAESALSTSVAADLDDAARAKYVAHVNAQLDVLRNAVDPVAQRRITLAGRATEIPITLHNKLDEPVKVKVRLSSAKLTFPDGDQTLLLEGTQQIRVPVKTRASGTFPMTVEVLTPEGDVRVAPATQLTVQVSALSGLGIVLIVGLLLILVTWWVHHVRTTRRRRSATLAATRHPATGTT